jgi:hypothetical protein
MPSPDQTIRRGKIGGRVALKGQAGANEGPAGGWEEILRTSDVTAGNPVTREGGQANADTHTIFSAFLLKLPESDDPLAASQPPPRVHLRIEIADGNDNGAGKEVYRVLAGAPVTVSGSSFFISAQIFLDEVGVVKAPPTITGQVEAFISIGGGEDVQPTLWPRNLPDTGVPTPPLGAFGQVSLGPSRLRSIQGFSDSATDTFIMFFDWPGPNVLPPNGAVPLFTFRLPAGATVTDDFIESTRAFSWGIFWAASSTPDVLTFDGAQAIRMDPELYAQDQMTGGV